MDMIDTRKCFRGVLLWREDIIKCAKCAKKPLSGLVRDMLHDAMAKYTISEEDEKILQKQIEDAMCERRRKHANLNSRGKGSLRVKGHRSLTVDRIVIPAKSRKNAKFVSGE